MKLVSRCVMLLTMGDAVQSESIGRLVKRLRLERGLTQGQTAPLTNDELTRPWLAQLESNWIDRPDNDKPVARSHRHIAVAVVGDCLAPRLLPGQRAIVNLDASPKPGDIVMALHEGETILKILEQRDGEFWLVALQGRPPLNVGENTTIQGVARMYMGWL